MVKPRRIPIHEAAHAVIAMELGVQVQYATIKSESDFPGQVEHADATARQGAMIAVAGPMAVAMTANIEYNLGWARDLTSCGRSFEPWRTSAVFSLTRTTPPKSGLSSRNFTTNWPPTCACSEGALGLR